MGSEDIDGNLEFENANRVTGEFCTQEMVHMVNGAHYISSKRLYQEEAHNAIIN